MTMHEEWTDKLSDYVDGELPPVESAAVEAHLRDCPACAAVLEDLERVIARARDLRSQPPQADLWDRVASRIELIAQPRRFAFTLPQVAAAAALLIAISGMVAVELVSPPMRPAGSGSSQAVEPSGPPMASGQSNTPVSVPSAGDVLAIGLADAQYDSAVADLEKALKQGRGRLDASTIAIVEHNLQIIDQAIAQAREALASDPANTYLAGHVVEARRRKLDLLRRAAALAEGD